MRPTVLANPACRIAENPLWHPDECALYWIDVPVGRLYRYDPDTDTNELVFECDFIGGLLLQADGSLLLFHRDGRISDYREGELTTHRADLPDEDPGVAFNDAIADPEGRVLCGVRYDDERLGGLYRIDIDRSATKVVEDVKLSNGLGFAPDDDRLYYTDSMRRTIYEFAYDSDTGTLSNRRPFVTVDEGNGLPDGLTVDTEGYVWSARAHEYAVVRYASTGEEVDRLELPVRLPTSVGFGDRDYGSLYVTTGGGHKTETHGDDAGGLFRCTPDVGGREQYRARIGFDA